jgi:cell division protein FtsW (lipid II flippase)
MPPIEKLREYTNTVCSQIRWKKARETVSEEIHSHLMDQREAYIQEGTTEDTATEQAIADMGDPVTVGIQLDRVHRPKPQWGMLGVVFVIVVVGIILQALVQNDIATRFRTPIMVGYQFKFALIGLGVFIIAYFIDFSIIGKYPKTTYIAILCLFLISLFISPLRGGAPYYATYCSLLFPLGISGMVYAMRGEGYWGITVCVGAILFPAALAWMAPTVAGFVLTVTCGMVILGIAISKNWFQANKLRSYLWAYLPFLGATLLFASTLLRTPYNVERLRSFLHPESDPLGGGYVALVMRSLLKNAQLWGNGTMPQQFAERQSFPLPSIHSDLMLTYLIFRLGWLPFGLIVALLVLFIVHSFRQCWRQKSVLSQLVSYSVLLTFALQTFHYITYNTGILLFAPLSLPLMSYGLGGMVINMGLLGLMLSVFRNGSAARDRAQPSSARQPFITWRERKLVIDFGRKHGE